MALEVLSVIMWSRLSSRSRSGVHRLGSAAANTVGCYELPLKYSGGKAGVKKKKNCYVKITHKGGFQPKKFVIVWRYAQKTLMTILWLIITFMHWYDLFKAFLLLRRLDLSAWCQRTSRPWGLSWSIWQWRIMGRCLGHAKNCLDTLCKR